MSHLTKKTKESLRLYGPREQNQTDLEKPTLLQQMP